VWWRQESIVFQPPRPPYPTPRVARVEYAASDGQPLFAYLVSDADSAVDTVVTPARGRRVLIVFHGNADLAGWLVPWAREVARRTGHLVVLTEYRGYAGLGGSPTYAASRLDARAAWSLVVDSLGAAPADVSLFGHSLGSAVATELAIEHRPRRLVLMSPLTSAREMATRMILSPVMLAWPVISRVHYDTRARVASLDVPVWVTHGERDLIIPARMGRDVFDAAKVKGELLLVPNAGHNDVWSEGGELYWTWMERALK
jgi:pimeloyl-ACP methyl ester carboxylesterase